MTTGAKDILLEEVGLDIKLKEILIEQFESIAAKQKKIARRQLMVIMGIGIVLIAVVISGFIYYSKTRELFLKTMRHEVEEIAIKRDSLRFEKELFYRIRDTNEHYVRPMYDTIK